MFLTLQFTLAVAAKSKKAAPLSLWLRLRMSPLYLLDMGPLLRKSLLTDSGYFRFNL